MSAPPQADVQWTRSNARAFPAFLLAWILIAGLAVASVVALRPPRPLPATTAENEFSAERAFVHVREMSRVPHPIDSAANASVRSYLIAQLSRLGVQASVFSGIGLDPTARLVIGGKTNDVVGLLPGSAGGPAILLMAHYDSVPHAPGAGDDASGVAAVLETVRALHAGPALQRDLIVLFTDGEEPGLLGAESFAHDHPWARNVGLILNFDARGDRGPSLLFETSANNAELIDAVARAAPHPIGSSLFYELYRLLPNYTDFSAFRSSGVPGLNFAFGEGLDEYHSPLDTADRLSLASVQHHGSYGLSLVRHFGQLDLATLRQARGDKVFFDWFGDRLVTYGKSWVLPGQLLVTVLLALIFVVAMRARAFHARTFFLALGGCIAVLAVVTAVAAAAWWLIALVLGERRIFTDSTANLFLLCGLAWLSACVGTLLLTWLRKRLGFQELWLAALSFWCVLSWLLTLLLPSASYLLFWPLLLAVAGNLSVHLFRSGGSGALLRAFPALAATILLFAPVTYLLYVFLTLQMTSVVALAVLIALFLLISAPLLEALLEVSMGWGWATLGLVAVLCLACGVALSGHTADHPQPDSLVYSLNADDNSAVWITYNEHPDAWTRQFLTEHPQGPQPLQKYLAGLARPFLSAPAPAVPLLPPLMEIVENSQDRGVHRLKLRVRSQRNADALYVRFPQDLEPVSMKVAGRDFPVQKNGGRFGLIWSGMKNESLEFELVIKGASISLWLMDRSNSLPVETPARPNNLTVEDGSDVTFVCRKYTL